MLPVSHLSHFGIVKLNTAALEVPLLVTLAFVQASHVVVVQTEIVAAVHVSPVSHLSHLGIQKLNTAALLVQELVTVAELPGDRVDVVPTETVAAVQVSHFKSILASVRVTTFQSSSVKSISFQLKAALTIAGQV